MWEIIKTANSSQLAEILNDRKVKPENVLYFGEEYSGFGEKAYSFLVWKETRKPRKKADPND